MLPARSCETRGARQPSHRPHHPPLAPLALPGPYCTNAKNALAPLVSGAGIVIHELDKMPNGSAIQAALAFTGATSVPRVVRTRKPLARESHSLLLRRLRPFYPPHPAPSRAISQFIGGKFLGGGDDTVAASRNGSLKKLIDAARASA